MTSVAVSVAVQCRLCAAPLRHVVADLGAMPLANAYLTSDELTAVESYYPLRALLCTTCGLVQLEVLADPNAIFGSHYGYFSSFSSTLLRHSEAYADMITSRLGLHRGDRVVEIASNDGYLLQYLVAQGIDALGIEPAPNVAAQAVRRGVPTLVRFFGADVARALAAEDRRARLIVANNVLAHVTDLNDFIAGLRILLEPGGAITLEFHHLLHLVAEGQFDTIYHEHFQYFSLGAAQKALAAHGLTVVDVEELSTQGGSLRVYARHDADVSDGPGPRVAEVLAREDAARVREVEGYAALADRMAAVKLGLLSFLVNARKSGQSVVCYGAAAKGTTLLNYGGVHADLIDYVVDRSPHKQGLFMPGSRLPIHHPARVAETKPDYVLILPYNIRDEIIGEMSHVRSWGGRFVVAIPELHIVEGGPGVRFPEGRFGTASV